MKTRKEILEKFTTASKEAARFYLWHYVPLGRLEVECVAYTNELIAILRFRHSAPLEGLPSSWEIKLDIPVFERFLGDIKSACAGVELSKKIMAFNVRDPSEMCILISDEDGEVFIQVDGLQGSAELNGLRVSVLKIIEDCKKRTKESSS